MYVHRTNICPASEWNPQPTAHKVELGKVEPRPYLDRDY